MLMSIGVFCMVTMTQFLLFVPKMVSVALGLDAVPLMTHPSLVTPGMLNDDTIPTTPSKHRSSRNFSTIALTPSASSSPYPSAASSSSPYPSTTSTTSSPNPSASSSTSATTTPTPYSSSHSLSSASAALLSVTPTPPRRLHRRSTSASLSNTPKTRRRTKLSLATPPLT
eukprot:TRINITY_DN14175_c0_g1_i1.p1 TRINITY_DN14175_c0_g1~~TRINITY_DN14175_c0_g1_i1.p1  ORF type:complete len:170 (+),score=37.11 TRINITY_DN14175_c0_g1_i1:55-564(+)